MSARDSLRHALAGADDIATSAPVAVLAVDVSPAHLDRPFEYLVPAHLDDLVRPGVRVRVRFAGQDVDGYVLHRRDTPEHSGRLSPIRRVVGPDAVLTPDLLALARSVAHSHAGTLAEVLRLAIPPRHAQAEKVCPPPLPERSEGAAVGADGGSDGGSDGGQGRGPDDAEAVAVDKARAGVSAPGARDSSPAASADAAKPVHPAGPVASATSAAVSGPAPATGPAPAVVPAAPAGPVVSETAAAATGPVASAAPSPATDLALPAEPPAIDPGPWSDYPAGASFIRRLATGQSPAAAWSALPIDAGPWAQALAVAAQATLESGRGVVLVVPDHRDVAAVDAALTSVLGRGRHVRLSADQGPQARYTAWLKLLRGHVRCVIGARAAAYAPVRNVGLVAWWDDGDDLHQEPRAPYPHVRDVLLARARLEGAAVLAGGWARSVGVQALVETGTLREIVPEAALRRRASPRVHVAGQGAEEEKDGPAVRAHLPSSAWRAARDALSRGPVLVQVPRRGYLPALSCAHCRTRARCPHCHGTLAVAGSGSAPTCTSCARPSPDWRCPECAGQRLRRVAVGARRTAEELGRAFPGATVRTSGSGDVLATVPSTPALVIATPGAEPLVEGGYAATLLLDAWASLERPSLDASEEAVRRWLHAAALTRRHADGGVVVLAGVPDHARLPAVEAVVRWAPEWHAERELAERRDLALPPTVWTARLTGAASQVDAAHAQLPELGLPPGVEGIGPVPLSPAEPPALPGGGPGMEEARASLLLRAPWQEATAAAEALVRLRRARSVHRRAGILTIRIGAPDLGG